MTERRVVLWDERAIPSDADLAREGRMSELIREPAERSESAHLARRYGRYRDPQAWPCRAHRLAADVTHAELDAAVERAGERVNDAFNRTVTP